MGYTTWTRYDAWNRPVAVTDALGWCAGDPQHTTTTVYDQRGRVASVTDPLGRTVDYTYDNLGRETVERLPEPTPQAPQGRPTTYFGYDAVGNLKYTTDPLGSEPADDEHTTWYFYDTWNRQVCTIDALAELSSAQGMAEQPPASPTTHRTLTVYDARGNVSETTDPMGRTTNYQYDNLGRQTAEQLPEPTPQAPQGRPTTYFAYDPAGNLTSVTDPLSHTTWHVYDELNREIRSVDALGSGPNDLDHATVTAYDTLGRVSSVTDAEGNTTSYTYDRLGRLRTETDPLTHPTTLVYDAAGNLVKKTDRNARVTEYSYDPLGRVVEERWRENAQGRRVPHDPHVVRPGGPGRRHHRIGHREYRGRGPIPVRLRQGRPPDAKPAWRRWTWTIRFHNSPSTASTPPCNATGTVISNWKMSSSSSSPVSKPGSCSWK